MKTEVDYLMELVAINKPEWVAEHTRLVQKAKQLAATARKEHGFGVVRGFASESNKPEDTDFADPFQYGE